MLALFPLGSSPTVPTNWMGAPSMSERGCCDKDELQASNDTMPKASLRIPRNYRRSSPSGDPHEKRGFRKLRLTESRRWMNLLKTGLFRPFEELCSPGDQSVSLYVGRVS